MLKLIKVLICRSDDASTAQESDYQPNRGGMSSDSSRLRIKNKPKMNCSYTFSIDLTSNGVAFGSKLFRKGKYNLISV